MDILRLMRPQQYIKNLFIFVPLFFAVKITDTTLLKNDIIAFIAFSLTASAIYILNDFKDIEDDKQHPKKKNRPLASGAISKTQALIAMLTLLALGFIIASAVSLQVVGVISVYVVMNIAYSFHLKHVAILDVVIIAVGFVLRVFIGSAATGIQLSIWIIIMTFLLALFIALAKRRDDVIIFMETGKKMRKVIDGYNLQFLNAAMAIMSSVVIVSYIMYTTSAEVVEKFHSRNLYLTSLFVILGIMRYLQISFVSIDSGSPTKIVLKDHFMQLTILAWLASFIWILY